MKLFVALCVLLVAANAGQTYTVCPTIPGGVFQRVNFNVGTPATCNSPASGCSLGVQLPIGLTNVMKSGHFFTFPFVQPTNPAVQCNPAFFGCPNLFTPAIVDFPISNTSTLARATHLSNGEYIDFEFNSGPIGAIGFDYAVTADTVLTVTFGNSIADVQAAVPPVQYTTTVVASATLTPFFIQPDVVPLHAATFTYVRIAATQINPLLPTSGRWIVLDNLVYGRTGYGCCGTNRAIALSIDLRDLPTATSVAISGDGSGSNFYSYNGLTSVPNLGNTIPIFCVETSNPVVTIDDNHVVYQSFIDAGVITCGLSHTTNGTPAECSLDPRATYTLPTACNPVDPSDPTVKFGVALYLRNTPNGNADIRFREVVNFFVGAPALNPTFTVLAVNGIYGSISAIRTNPITLFRETIADARGVAVNCRHSSTTLIQPCATNPPRVYPVANWINFRTHCNELPGDVVTGFQTTDAVTVNLWFPIPVFPAPGPVSWSFPNRANQDFRVCIPMFGNYSFNAVEKNGALPAVTSETASANCLAQLGSQCNGTPQNLVSVINEPLVCDRVPLCDDTFAPVASTGPTAGYGVELSYQEKVFRTYSGWDSFTRRRICVLNLKAVTMSLPVATVDPTLTKRLDAVFDCTSGASSPGDCLQLSGPERFFSMLRVDALKLPNNIHFDISLVVTSEEDNESVCSKATLLGGVFCNRGDTLQYICVPAIGMDPEVTSCGKVFRPMRLEVNAEECAASIGGSTYQQCTTLPAPGLPAECALFASSCIQKTVPLDCRNSFPTVTSTNPGCNARLAQELSIWDLLALPMDVSVDLLPPTSEYTGIPTSNAVVRSVGQQGACPRSYWVLCDDLRVRITEGSAEVISEDIDCSKEKTCNYNDFLATVDLNDAIRFQGNLVLDAVVVTIAGLPTRGYKLGKNCVSCQDRKISLLKKSRPYSLIYTWLNGYSRTVSTTCTGCKSCAPLPIIVRWFAVNSTCPVHTDFHLHLDFDGSVLNDHSVHTEKFKFHGNKWGAVTATVRDAASEDRTLCTMPHKPCIASQPTATLGDYDIYFVLAKDAQAPTTPIVPAPNAGYSNYEITINQGCAKETYFLECGIEAAQTGLRGCTTGCVQTPPAAPTFPVIPSSYLYYCRWLPTSGGQPTPLHDPAQTGGIGSDALACPPPAGATGCPIGTWKALTPLVNLCVDLRCLPDGSSTLGDVIPDDGSQDNYRGRNYTNFDGVLTQRVNPIDINFCCGTSCTAMAPPVTPRNGCGDLVHTPCVPVDGPAGSNCMKPVVLSEAGGFNNIMCGLLQRTSSYAVSVQELFRTENRKQYTEVEPQGFDRCSVVEKNAAWDKAIRALRPTKCYVGATENLQCHDNAGRTCTRVFTNCRFTNKFDKGEALNYQNAMMMIKFVYGVRFQRQYNANTNVVPGGAGATVPAYTPPTSIKPHTLLRPNRLAVPRDLAICVVEDTFYSLIVFSGGAPTVGPRFDCNARAGSNLCVPEDPIRYWAWRCLVVAPNCDTTIDPNCVNVLFQNQFDSKRHQVNETN